MRLYLVRHGQTSWNLDQRAQGHCDVLLDETGERQAKEVAVVFRGLKAERVVSSDLARSADTARPIAETLGVSLETEPLFRERNFGSLEGCPYDTVRESLAQIAEQNGGDPMKARPEGGESLADVWERVAPALQGVVRSGKSSVLVSHGGTISLMIAQLIGGDLGVSRAFRLTNAAVTELALRPDGGWSILRLNDRSHLEVAREGFGTGS